MLEAAANMGSATEALIMDFAERVREDLGLWGVKVEWTPAQPSIWIPPTIFLRRAIVGHYPWAAKEEVLHEFTHVLGGNGHGETFYDAYARLVSRFLGSGNEMDYGHA